MELYLFHLNLKYSIRMVLTYSLCRTQLNTQTCIEAIYFLGFIINQNYMIKSK